MPLIVIFPDSLLQRSLLAINWGQIAAFIDWDELSPFQNRTNGRLG